MSGNSSASSFNTLLVGHYFIHQPGMKFNKQSAVLTARSCRMSMSEAFSEMLPTKTVVVGPQFSSFSLFFKPGWSFLTPKCFPTIDTVVGTNTYKEEEKFKNQTNPMLYFTFKYVRQKT